MYPEHCPQPVFHIIHPDHFAAADDFRHPPDHLFFFYAILFHKLIIPAKYITVCSFSDYPMQYKCTIFSFIKYDIVFSDLILNGCKCDLITSLLNKRMHTRPFRIKSKITASCKDFPDRRLDFLQFYLLHLHTGCSPALIAEDNG